MDLKNFTLHNPYLIKNKTTLAVSIEKLILKSIDFINLI